MNEDSSCTKKTKDAIEQLEKSGITEENGPPCSILNPYDSSDSTQDSSKKRRKLAGAPDVSHNNHGLILRIKLPLQKHKDAERAATNEQPSRSGGETQLLPKHRDQLLLEHRYPKPPATNDQPCFSGRLMEGAALLRKQKDPEPPAINGQPCLSGRVVEVPPLLQKHKAQELPATNEQPSFLVRVVEPAAGVTAGGQSRSEQSSSSSRTKKMEWQFKEIILNWNPPPLQFEEPDIGDQEWLFGAKEPRPNPSAKKCGASPAEVQDQGIGMTSLQTQARYIHEFDMYELPYAIPF